MSKKQKYYTSYGMKEKAQSCNDLLFLIWEGLILVTGPVFSLRELSRDLKATDFRFKILGKTMGFRSYFDLRSEKRILK